MAKNSMDAYGAEGKTNVLLFDPEKLVIVTDEKHPLFDKRGLEEPEEWMVRSVKHVGIMQPISVRKNPETGETEVIAGRKRVLAARAANKLLVAEGSQARVQVPAVVRRGPDALMSLLVVIENEHREADTPLNRADKIRRLTELGVCEEDIGHALRCSVSTVRNLLSLLDCTAAVRNAVDKGELPASEGYKLAKKTPEEQREAVAKVLAHTNGSTAKRKKGVKAAMGGGGMRGKREILKMREKYEPGEADSESAVADAIVNTLSWVLGERERIGVKV